jgi:hypothetical protein
MKKLFLFLSVLIFIPSTFAYTQKEVEDKAEQIKSIIPLVEKQYPNSKTLIDGLFAKCAIRHPQAFMQAVCRNMLGVNEELRINNEEEEQTQTIKTVYVPVYQDSFVDLDALVEQKILEREEQKRLEEERIKREEQRIQDEQNRLLQEEREKQKQECIKSYEGKKGYVIINGDVFSTNTSFMLLPLCTPML